MFGRAMHIGLWAATLPVGIVALAASWPSWLSFSTLEGTPLGFFLRPMNLSNASASAEMPKSLVERLEGVTHYRLVPGIFPSGMHFHFDGLATVVKFSFKGGRLEWTARAYESEAEKHYSSCIFAGTGTGPTVGYHPCLTNPVVNLLPIKDQLWLTTDTSKWGRVHPETLATLPDEVEVDSTVLNAHPACDPSTDDCFVQYNCGQDRQPYTNQACVGRLQTAATGMKAEEVSRTELPSRKLIQHSHSPCVTEHYVVSKIDSFTPRSPLNSNSGVLKLLQQAEDDLWLVMDRKTNKSTILQGSVKFVNNHFWNCYETPDGNVVIDSVAATENYLDNYFERNLAADHANWTRLFHPALRCTIPAAAGGAVACENLFEDGAGAVFDYPTFNPAYKMNPNYRFFYGISAQGSASRWFDELIKVDVQSRKVVQRWSSPGIFLTEADFIPWRGQAQAGSRPEDEGMLLSVLYNATDDQSSLGIFDAASLKLLHHEPMGAVIPFHAHGIVCVDGKCYSNP
mmetsp:Transcript_42582/g.95599  ORF Transcript_42582/g.95599 Transcript_42582/m.95599 type:complete len:513 (+) Transcript_42582:74-1612(+)